MSWCVLCIPCLPYTCYPPLTRHVRASRRDRAQPRAWPQATRATRRRRAGAHRASQAWPASCHPEALRRWRDRRRAREAEAVEVLRALAQSACIGLAGRRRLLRPACQASHTCGLSTSQPCARAGHSTEGSKGSVESGRTSRGATSDAPSGSSAKRRLDAADMRSPKSHPNLDMFRRVRVPRRGGRAVHVCLPPFINMFGIDRDAKLGPLTAPAH